MDFQDYTRFVLALVLVLGLIGALVWVLRRSGFTTAAGRGKRLSVTETMMVGPRHRMLLVRRDDVEHLLLLGPNGQMVVEAGIKSSSGQSPDFATYLSRPEPKP